MENCFMFSKYFRTALIAFVAVICLSIPAFAADEKPDATFSVSGGAGAVGIGVQWGTGTLTYQGKTYNIRYDGLSLGEIGGAGKNLTGEVYGLKSVSDFEGRYAAVKTGLTVAGGGEVSVMTNDKGVKIHLSGVERGLKLSFGTEGMKFSLVHDAEKTKS